MAYEMNCTPGYRQCSGNLLFECDADGSGWFMAGNCSYVCSNGECWPGPGGLSGLEQYHYAVFIIVAVAACLAGYLLFKRFRRKG
jgi:hypothetical protein